MLACGCYFCVFYFAPAKHRTAVADWLAETSDQVRTALQLQPIWDLLTLEPLLCASATAGNWS